MRHMMKCGHPGDCIITDIPNGNERIDVEGCSTCWDAGNKNSIHIDDDYKPHVVRKSTAQFIVRSICFVAGCYTAGFVLGYIASVVIDYFQ